MPTLTRTSPSILAALLAASTTACGGAPPSASDEVASGITVGNGIRLNGIRLNGIRLNGIRLNGIRLNGIRLNGIRLNGSALAAESLDVAAIQGALLEGRLDDGSPVDLRVDAVDASGELVRYWLSADLGGQWQSVCESDDVGAPLPATLVSGLWNQASGVPGGGEWSASDDQVSIACANGAIYKCLDAGYRPWSLGEASYPTHLQACIRMIRADYCGDGAPWTVNGRTIDVWDDLGIQTRSARWPVEAEWGPQGAACLLRPRVVFGGVTPLCVRQRMATACGQFRAGSVLIDAPETTLAEESMIE